MIASDLRTGPAEPLWGGVGLLPWQTAKAADHLQNGRNVPKLGMEKGPPWRVFISYSHKDQAMREVLADHLATLQREGVIDVWHDRKIAAGEAWAGEIDANLEAADIVLCLVSAGFLASTYCGDIELKRALERHETGDARVIPVILKPADWNNTPLGGLQALPSEGKAVTKWTNRDEAYLSIARGIRDVARQLAREPPPPPLELENPEGTVRLGSPYYVPPADGLRSYAALESPGALIRIKSPKGFGKSSLTARLLDHARTKGHRTVSLNLEATDQKFFSDPDRFMQWFCASVGKELGLRMRTEDYWDSETFGANDNSRDYFETYLLKPNPTPLVLAIDNFDRIFTHPSIQVDFCGLLRSWHELGRNSMIWERFRLVLAHSLEPYVEMNIYQSPLNVGIAVELGELKPDQVRHLVALHQLQLSDAELEQLLDLVGGHPYLVRKALYELALGLPFSTFFAEAPTEGGIYGDKLRGILKVVEDHPQLNDALWEVLKASKPVRLRPQDGFLLESLGVLVPEKNLMRPRCQLFSSYLTDRLAR